MDEPKGGPVKPPTLDLKPTKSTRVKPGGTRADVKKTTQTTPKARASSATKVSSSPRASKSEAQESKPVYEKAASNAQAGVSSPVSDTMATQSRKSSSSYLTVVAGAIGGALLALLIIIPLLLSGALQSGNEQQKQIDDLAARAGLSEEQTHQSLIGYNTLNEQINSLTNQFASEIEKMGAGQTNLEAQQSDLVQKWNAIISRQDELLENINVLQSSAQIEFDPSVLIEEIRMLNQRIDAIDAGASSADAEMFANDLVQIHNEIEALESTISTKIEGDIALKVQNLIDESTANLQADILAHSGQIEANHSHLNDINTRLDETRAMLVELDTRSQISDLGEGLTSSDSSGFSHGSSLALDLERAVTAGEGFDQQLGAYLLNFSEVGISEALMQRSQVGINTQQELIVAFNLVLPKMLAARPGVLDANWLERFGNSLKSLFAIRTTGERDGNPVDNSLNRLQGALGEGNYEDAWYWLGQLPEPMQDALGDVGIQISLLREIGILLGADNELTHLHEEISQSDLVSDEIVNNGGGQ